MGTAIVGLALLGLVCLIIRSMIRKKKNGEGASCGGDCSRCHGCH